jgi:hypothetical protein
LLQAHPVRFQKSDGNVDGETLATLSENSLSEQVFFEWNEVARGRRGGSMAFVLTYSGSRAKSWP